MVASSLETFPFFVRKPFLTLSHSPVDARESIATSRSASIPKGCKEPRAQIAAGGTSDISMPPLDPDAPVPGKKLDREWRSARRAITLQSSGPVADKQAVNFLSALRHFIRQPDCPPRVYKAVGDIVFAVDLSLKSRLTRLIKLFRSPKWNHADFRFTDGFLAHWDTSAIDRVVEYQVDDWEGWDYNLGPHYRDQPIRIQPAVSVNEAKKGETRRDKDKKKASRSIGRHRLTRPRLRPKITRPRLKRFTLLTTVLRATFPSVPSLETAPRGTMLLGTPPQAALVTR